VAVERRLADQVAPRPVVAAVPAPAAPAEALQAVPAERPRVAQAVVRLVAPVEEQLADLVAAPWVAPAAALPVAQGNNRCRHTGKIRADFRNHFRSDTMRL
jgi:hypothetical protein